MASVMATPRAMWTAADLVRRFGPMPLDRIRIDGHHGQATEKDVLAIYRQEKRLCELVDGFLVEKAMGIRESFLAVEIARLLGNFAKRFYLGMVLGADGMTRLAPGLVRIPDVSFVAWDQLPGRTVPNQPMLQLAPALAVEVLSPHNTRKEMARKLRDYFKAGVRLVWYIDPDRRCATVYTAPECSVVLSENQVLDGGDVLPGFTLSLKDLFESISPSAQPPIRESKTKQPGKPSKGATKKRK
jgi:Uma2 family endonuclease